jgi:hypothetical protein
MLHTLQGYLTRVKIKKQCVKMFPLVKVLVYTILIKIVLEIDRLFRKKINDKVQVV